jgi:ATP-dependent 26S proteasome regulatory subunit
MPSLTKGEEYKSAHDISNDLGVLFQGFGGPNFLMMGSPGTGKTMLARRLPTILI